MLAQQWLVCAPLGIHLEPINRVNAVSENIIIINCAMAQRENCAVPNKKLFGPMVRHISLSKNTAIEVNISLSIVTIHKQGRPFVTNIPRWLQ